MILSKNTILKLIDEKKLVIDPDPIIKEASVKAHLSGIFGKDRESMREIGSYTLNPHEFILSRVREVITLPSDISAFFDGYVGVASKGLLTHCGSMYMDPGETQQIILEMFNASDKPIELIKDMRIGQYIFCQIG